MGSHAEKLSATDRNTAVTTEQNGTPKFINELQPSPAAPPEWSVENGMYSPFVTPNDLSRSLVAALETFSLPNPAAPPASPLAFMHFLQRLKTTKREGWRRFGIGSGESISDHMYRMSIITMLAPPSLKAQGLNIPRCTQMAVVHDMAESLVGDLTPRDNVAKTEKSRREETTMRFLTEKLLGSDAGGMDQAGKEIMELWHEYEEGNTLESKFVHDVDKLELLLQMNEYEKDFEKEKDLGEFAHVAKRIELPEMRAWCHEVLQERKDFWGKEHDGKRGAEEVEKVIRLEKN